MHSLQELVDVVTKNKIKSIRMLSPSRDRDPDMLHDFYIRLINREFASDAKAAKFYGYADEHCKGYRKQRLKLENRLKNTLFFIDTGNPKFSDAQKAFYQCQKNLMTVRIFIGSICLWNCD